MRLVGSGSQQPAEGGRWGTVLAVQRERLASPDLYLLDSPAGAIHRRGKAELHLGHYGTRHSQRVSRAAVKLQDRSSRRIAPAVKHRGN